MFHITIVRNCNCIIHDKRIIKNPRCIEEVDPCVKNREDEKHVTDIE